MNKQSSVDSVLDTLSKYSNYALVVIGAVATTAIYLKVKYT